MSTSDMPLLTSGGPSHLCPYTAATLHFKSKNKEDFSQSSEERWMTINTRKRRSIMLVTTSSYLRNKMLEGFSPPATANVEHLDIKHDASSRISPGCSQINTISNIGGKLTLESTTEFSRSNVLEGSNSNNLNNDNTKTCVKSTTGLENKDSKPHSTSSSIDIGIPINSGSFLDSLLTDSHCITESLSPSASEIMTNESQASQHFPSTLSAISCGSSDDGKVVPRSFNSSIIIGRADGEYRSAKNCSRRAKMSGSSGSKRKIKRSISSQSSTSSNSATSLEQLYFVSSDDRVSQGWGLATLSPTPYLAVLERLRLERLRIEEDLLKLTGTQIENRRTKLSVK